MFIEDKDVDEIKRYLVAVSILHFIHTRSKVILFTYKTMQDIVNSPTGIQTRFLCSVKWHAVELVWQPENNTIHFTARWLCKDHIIILLLVKELKWKILDVYMLYNNVTLFTVTDQMNLSAIQFDQYNPLLISPLLLFCDMPSSKTLENNKLTTWLMKNLMAVRLFTEA